MSSADAANAMELWGGVECTINRVGNDYFHQLRMSGHDRRPSDLNLIADLGIRTLRYPVLWEQIAPDGVDNAQWRWADERLMRLRSLGMQPIVGLVHHGSGPRNTNLLDPEFDIKLAAYARAVAERYPWVDMYTPVNEPLTTARFSALYGLWYPHARDDLSFAKALIHQCRGVVLAMREIRKVNPEARLVQTDDLGHTSSTPLLQYQADFDNERRWLSFDLLCGRVQRDHPLWQFLRYVGLSESDLAWFQDNPCPPDLLGLNYYITSERHLDERLEFYPAESHGGNGRHRYADVEAVRARPEGIMGARPLLKAAWDRYGIPIAITEVQLACTPDEQMRWLWEIWTAAAMARRDGVDLRAVTAWALLGAFDWDCLVTQSRGCYEPGAFAICDGAPQPTPLAELIRALARGSRPQFRELESPGWWRRPERLLCGPAAACK